MHSVVFYDDQCNLAYGSHVRRIGRRLLKRDLRVWSDFSIYVYLIWEEFGVWSSVNLLPCFRRVVSGMLFVFAVSGCASLKLSCVYVGSVYRFLSTSFGKEVNTDLTSSRVSSRPIFVNSRGFFLSPPLSAYNVSTT